VKICERLAKRGKKGLDKEAASMKTRLFIGVFASSHSGRGRKSGFHFNIFFCPRQLKY
jgi:hypothetical protein